MKPALLALFAALIIAPSLVALPVQAKSVKWHCVALDPATPWHRTCYPSTTRP